jgi:hypothetical protein
MDKERARKATKNHWRTLAHVLHVSESALGWQGSLSQVGAGIWSELEARTDVMDVRG